MGKPMVENLIKAGNDVMVYDINQVAMDAVVKQGAVSGDPKSIGEACKIIFTNLPNGSIVQEVLFGNDGVADGIMPESIVVDLSSVTPIESITCAKKFKELDVYFIDSPVSGGEPKAIDGTLSFMAGGEKEAFESILPYLEVMGASAVLVGDSGCGSTTKLTNQIIVNLTIAVVSEAFVLAAKAGVDIEKAYQAIRGGLAGSVVLDAKIPKIMNRDFEPGGKISINLKDIKNVMATAHDMDVPLPLTAQLLEILQSLKVLDYMDEDHSSIVKYFEKLAGVEVVKN